jgi:hypothetical protein
MAIGRELTELLQSLDPVLRDWVGSSDSPQSTRWPLRRCAYGSEKAFDYEFQFEARAARAILRRLAKYGLEDDPDEADERAMERLSAAY